jgi:hypothetical protein
MDEDLKSLIAALNCVADSDAKMRNLASKRLERSPVEWRGPYGAGARRQLRCAQEQGN